MWKNCVKIQGKIIMEQFPEEIAKKIVEKNVQKLCKKLSEN